ncbi:hypothetical protein ARMGADRAFT_1021442, partial [Armillaria gallica]
MIERIRAWGLRVRVLIGGNWTVLTVLVIHSSNVDPLCEVEVELSASRRLTRLTAIRVGVRMDGCGVGAIKGGVPDDESGLLLDGRCGREQLETRRWQGGACLTESQKGGSRRWTSTGTDGSHA